ncbi:hypothetical protein [Actinoplanes siamensis]|uniref:Uncharacterized protein n=1 Tax=Actinoplanes siamensis TaxID=1223317 RepID=A0A919TNZ8_9ACTN|nr:hypothetical protein [Actinoplanes siamensis]GIF08678.1 hypothetical protein Asi03nite_62160 [Actinoplanes siamensis]
MRHPETDDDFRREVCDWFRANGVDPGRLRQDPQASIADGRLTFRRVVFRELTGTPMMDPAEPFEPLTEVVTVPLVVQPSADIAEWLRPKCPTCGR